MSSERGLDETKYTLTEHLTELRTRLGKALLAVVLTMCGALVFAPEVLEYSIQPLMRVLTDRARVETLLVHADDDEGKALADRLEEHSRVHFLGLQGDLSKVADEIRSRAKTPRPVDLVLVDSATIGAEGALVSDLLEGVEASPFVVYLVKDAKDPMVAELQLEGAAVILSPPRAPVLNRVVRRAAAAAGKAGMGDKLVVLSPLDPFFAYIKIALVVGIFLACPIWLYQLWMFVAPGLYSHERKVVLPAVLSASGLFMAGGAFAYYAMFPMMFDVLVNQMMPDTLAGSFTVDNYLGLLLRMTVAFGVVFELPLFMAMLAAIGVVTPELLRKYRRYAIVIAFIVGALLTPADPLSQVMMAVPLIVFYEVGILLASTMQKRREAAQAAALDDEPVAD
ncbi:MAG: twin-arginine translocase subunit TatC [Myxococcales bacterium]|nr:twin-arginine translocase subunit TatC [Myxococcales bacterium]